MYTIQPKQETTAQVEREEEKSNNNKNRSEAKRMLITRTSCCYFRNIFFLRHFLFYCYYRFLKSIRMVGMERVCFYICRTVG